MDPVLKKALNDIKKIKTVCRMNEDGNVTLCLVFDKDTFDLDETEVLPVRLNCTRTQALQLQRKHSN